MNFITQPRQASHVYTVGQRVLDTHFQIQAVRTAGTSGINVPGWSTTIGTSTTDGTVRWVNQGPHTAGHASWTKNHAYARRAEIVDTNGYVEAVTTPGSSSGTQPIWSTTVGAFVNDGGLRWRNVGAVATASIAAAGGSSGIILTT